MHIKYEFKLTSTDLGNLTKFFENKIKESTPYSESVVPPKDHSTCYAWEDALIYKHNANTLLLQLYKDELHLEYSSEPGHRWIFKELLWHITEQSGYEVIDAMRSQPPKSFESTAPKDMHPWESRSDYISRLKLPAYYEWLRDALTRAMYFNHDTLFKKNGEYNWCPSLTYEANNCIRDALREGTINQEMYTELFVEYRKRWESVLDMGKITLKAVSPKEEPTNE